MERKKEWCAAIVYLLLAVTASKETRENKELTALYVIIIKLVKKMTFISTKLDRSSSKNFSTSKNWFLVLIKLTTMRLNALYSTMISKTGKLHKQKSWEKSKISNSSKFYRGNKRKNRGEGVKRMLNKMLCLMTISYILIETDNTREVTLAITKFLIINIEKQERLVWTFSNGSSEIPSINT